jgi:hypothetical protein
MRSLQAAPYFCAAFVAALALSGCAAQSESAEQKKIAVGKATFSGSWASSLAQLYRDTPNRDIKNALKDGSISGQDYSYFEGKVEKCFTSIGVEGKLVDGTWEYKRPDRVPDSKVDDCLRDNGVQLLTLRDQMTRNPKNQDESTAMARCLVAVGAADPNYSARDYERELESGEFSFDADSDGASKCLADPFAS